MYETNKCCLFWWTLPSYGFDASVPSAAWHVTRSTHRSLKHLEVVTMLFFSPSKGSTKMDKMDQNGTLLFDIIIVCLKHVTFSVDSFFGCISLHAHFQKTTTHSAGLESFFCKKHISEHLGVKSYASFGKVCNWPWLGATLSDLVSGCWLKSYSNIWSCEFLQGSKNP